MVGGDKCRRKITALNCLLLTRLNQAIRLAGKRELAWLARADWKRPVGVGRENGSARFAAATATAAYQGHKPREEIQARWLVQP